MKKFEYKSVCFSISDYELNRLGSIGWELVSHSAVFVTSQNKISQYYVFKREINE